MLKIVTDFNGDAGLSASSITRLVATWDDGYQAFESRDLTGSENVFVWAGGVHFRIRHEEDRLCCLVLIGVKPMAPRDSWPVQMGIGSPPTRGPTCCVT